MTKEQIKKALALEHCSFEPTSYEAEFIEDMVKTAKESPTYTLTPRTVAYLNRLYGEHIEQEGGSNDG